MRILQLHNRYRQRGGEDGVLDAEAALLTKHGHRVSQMFVENPASDRAAALALTRSPWNRRTASAVSERIKAENPDIVHIHNTWFMLTGSSVAAAVAERPTVMTLHNYRLACVNAQFYRDGGACTDCLGGSPLPGVVHACYRGSRTASAAAAAAMVTIRRSRVLEQPGLVMLVHTPFAKDVLEMSGIRPERVEIHENFVADPGPRTRQAADSDEILFVGRLSEEKGVDLALEGWRGVTGRGLRLIVVGDGPDAAVLRDRAEGLPDVTLVGRASSEEVRERMLAARCLLVPSRWFESQPLVILEALAAGLPVIASDWAPIRAVLEAMPPGALTDVESWRSGALAPVFDDRWVASASAVARSLYLRRFTPRTAYDRLARIYTEISAARR